MNRLQGIISIALGSSLVVTVSTLLILKVHFLSFHNSLVAAVLGILTVDFVFGFFHWFDDTWLSTNIFIIRKFLTPIREHHDNPTAITMKDFLTLNANSFLIIIPKLAHVVYQHWSLNEEDVSNC
uniref:Lipid desaturase domain-containing protein n=1 Tax=Ditylenchus dipsaci TaxID=166011 RepID=A0A915DQA4_9BILA